MRKVLYPLRNIFLLAFTVFAALAAFSLALNLLVSVHLLFVVLFWFMAVPVLAYYVAFKLKLPKHAASYQAIAGLVIFYAFVLGMTYRLTNANYFQIIAVSFLPAILAVWYIQVIVQQLGKEQEDELPTQPSPEQTH